MEKYSHSHTASKPLSLQAFTLIELSIVLVIIGLIVGGIVAGTSLIKAAALRSTVGQHESFTIALHTFKNKYGDYPGDIPPARSVAFGLHSFTGVNAGTNPVLGRAYGNGNGFIEGPGCMYEGLMFWRQLSDSGLIPGNYGSVGNAAILSTTGNAIGAVTPIALSVPAAPIKGQYWMSTSIFTEFNDFSKIGPYNYLILHGLTFLATSACSGANTITPLELYTMDQKADDGLPNKGKIQNTIGAAIWAATPTSGRCTTGGSSWSDTAAVYNTSFGDIPACTGFFVW